MDTCWDYKIPRTTYHAAIALSVQVATCSYLCKILLLATYTPFFRWQFITEKLRRLSYPPPIFGGGSNIEYQVYDSLYYFTLYSTGNQGRESSKARILRDLR